ncbi:MAG TPA: insulinase family protein [Bacteroidales bacterium]|jgi:zinc protease|nr:insulinase family protein [Bacteroidales bacterium]MDI9572937.1 insulinase family protein [Bacteroidota bacterium]HOE59942.1 insulinase family protein [Bacteroidales bacterium]HOR05712.1 insulinase family protein [Bacteroidales bacterium]HOU35545.1 insulinase family protein [Bacteroidales bacterium]
MKRTLFLTGFLLMGFWLNAQFQYQPKASVPTDPSVKIGQLPNRLTYYIQKNGQPEKRAEFYLIVNAGAILEDVDQNGLAHFCEHMAFNGSKHFQKHQIINYLQSIGMKFGPEINAFTSHDVTAYMLQNVPLNDPAQMDTALLILYDWASQVSFEDAEIDAERGVIHEEWRTGRNAMERMNKQAMKKLFYNSKYAVHDVIGDIQIIDIFPYETVRRFYHDWYRPDLQAVIAVGDFDPQIVEQKILNLFGTLPKPENARERVVEKVPDHEETLVAIETDKEAQFTMVEVVYKHEPIEERNQEYLHQQLVTQLFNQMMNARLSELQRQADPPFIYAYDVYTNLVRSKDAYLAIAISKTGEAMRAIEALLTENERVLRYGFTEGELERAKNEILKQRENAFNERNKRKSEQLVWQYMNHFLENEPVPGPEFEYIFAKNLLPSITLEEVNALPSKWITDSNRVIVVQGPQKEGLIYPTEQEVLDLLARIEKEEITPYVDKVSDKPLISELPKPGKVIESSEDKATGVITWKLSNGAKVVIKPTDFKEDEILFAAISLGGSSLYPIEEYLSAQFAAAIIGESGLGDFDATELQKALSGKLVDLSPYIDDLKEGFNGRSSKSDLETLFQLLHLYFGKARADENIYGSHMNRLKAFLENSALDPENTFRDTIQVTMASYSPYRKPLTVERLSETNLSLMKQIFDQRFADADGFTYYFVGSFRPDELKPLIEKYLASLPSVKKNEQWRDLKIQPPKGTIKKTVVRDMEDPKATVFISLTGKFDYDSMKRLAMRAINDILSFRFVETIREEEGATYGTSVRTRLSKYPQPQYQLSIQFDCDPENAERMTHIVYQEIEKLRTQGPTEEQMRNFKENQLKTWAENIKENNFWMNKLTTSDFDGESYENILKFPEMLKILTPEMVKKVAQQCYSGENVVQIILMPSDLSKSVKNPNIKP